ncbi:transcriptional regulator FtsR [Demequina globuliformis]|uniref:transcriptional regulator FtsR n=1 Tax=Demequina globuliformis TaxID=676202 RepID=UPI00078022A3|nr:MerR family transcriptional regulator [Demequina globuliformis]
MSAAHAARDAEPVRSAVTRGPDTSASATGTWPRALSHEPMLRVSDVLAQVTQEFPALTSSKLRFLDSNGLVMPQRTSSGYRQYSPADVERVRFVLRQQRDHFRPLSVIAEYLDDLDAGRLHEPVTPHEVSRRDSVLTASQMAQAAGVESETIAALESAGVIAQSQPGRYERADVDLVVAAAAYLDAGGDARALKVLQRAADREAQAARDFAHAARARKDDARADAEVTQRVDAAVAVFSACVHRDLGR